MQWTYVADIADACVRAMEVPEASGEAFNVAHHERTTQREFVERLGRAAGIEARFASVPRGALLAAGGQLAGEPMYFGEYLDLPPHTENVEKAARLLGLAPTPLDAALKSGFAWYVQQPRRRVDYAFEDRVIALA